MARVFQYHSSIIPADGIGNSITLLHQALASAGIESYRVCADDQLRTSGPGVLPASGILNSRLGEVLSENDVLLLHHSFYDQTIEKLAQLPLRRVLIYHNITPGHFFREVGLDFLGDACDRGHGQLKQLASLFDLATGVSNFNSQELRLAGFRDVSTIPILFDADNFRHGSIDPALYFQLREAADVNILFVGRFVPNKRIDRLFALLEHFKSSFSLSIRLHLVGKIWDDQYFASLINRAAEMGVAGNIQFHLHADAGRLRTLYAVANAFVCMSDHEGFMVPLAEAFTSGCPVIAVDTAAIGETMGGAGLLMSSPDPAFAAGLLYLLVSDEQLRTRVISVQAQRALDFLPARTVRTWLETIRRLSAAP